MSNDETADERAERYQRHLEDPSQPWNTLSASGLEAELDDVLRRCYLALRTAGYEDDHAVSKLTKFTERTVRGWSRA